MACRPKRRPYAVQYAVYRRCLHARSIASVIVDAVQTSFAVPSCSRSRRRRVLPRLLLHALGWRVIICILPRHRAVGPAGPASSVGCGDGRQPQQPAVRPSVYLRYLQCVWHRRSLRPASGNLDWHLRLRRRQINSWTALDRACISAAPH